MKVKILENQFGDVWNGIHASLRNQCRKACGFDSHLEDEI